MNLEQVLNRYPAFLVCEREGRCAPWPGPNCVNKDLRPVSVWGGWCPAPRAVLELCVAAEMREAKAE